MVARFVVEGDQDEFHPDLWKNSPSNRLPRRGPETQLNVLIVGAGPSGLMTALECWRKGHNVVGILERSDGPVYTGDIIVIGPSALGAFRHWPDMCAELEESKIDSTMYYRKHSGELILGPTSLGHNDPDYAAAWESVPFAAPHQIRKKFYRMLLRQVAKVGLKVDYGQRIERYFEDEEARVGGVITDQGVVRVADLVVAADANKTRSEVLIAGAHTPGRSSGMSVYRTAFPTELALRDEAFCARWGDVLDKGGSVHEFWMGPGMHLGLFISRDFVAFGLTPRDRFLHEDGNEPIESWEPDVDPEEVTRVLNRSPGWDPVITGLVRNTHKGSIVHWPLLWRNLRREWTSKTGRVVQVGDAAHSSIPASISGGTLALEDAVTLASCLHLSCSSAGSKGGPMGARIYNLLRYQRVSCTQKMSFVNAQGLGGSAMEDAIKKNPESVRVRFPKWLYRHDPEAYVYEKYGQAFAHLVDGADFENTNLPPGHRFQSWTIEQIHEDMLAGKRVVDFLDGDWS
ncbi:hypothetical protein E4U54_005235 [Claviceps lovelessii]|nr:hypothetical protein E4U54_005235 [Claviceps lovelessii]